VLSLFKRRRFPVKIILLCVRWYRKYGISYRDLTEMMQERGVAVDLSTLFRWVQRMRPRSRSGTILSGFPFRAVDKHGQPIDFIHSGRRNTRAAYRLLRKALRAVSEYPPTSITTDKLASYPEAIQRLQKDGLLSKDVEHRTSKYLNNIIEADHGAPKRVIRPTRGFQPIITTYDTIKGFEGMRMIRRGHCVLPQPGAAGEVRLVNQLFARAA
jgi:transposase, IS6 family